MNNALEEIKRSYKPYRVTKKKKITIIDSTSGSFVIKEKENNKVKETYNYLLSRNFDYFPNLIDETRNEVNVYEYIDEIETPKEQKALDMIELVSLLHNKTTYYKEITEDKYKEIYENIKENILYSKAYYNNLYNILIEEIYPSPSHYLLLRNIYKIFGALDFCEQELDNWYEEVKENLRIRVALLHNNLETDHFIKNTKGYLISWENAKVDSPILDLIKFYENEYENLDFEPIFTKYIKNYTLSEDEKKLLFIAISIPKTISIEGDERKVTSHITKELNYIYTSEKLVKNFLNTSDK